jgi:transglutaminase-like putative cysteine protease
MVDYSHHKVKDFTDSTTTIRWWDVPAALLLLASLFTASFRLTATNWTEHLQLVHVLVFIGIIAGLALGQSQFNPKVVRIFALAYGVFIVTWQLGLTLPSQLIWRDRVAIIGERLWLTVTTLIQQNPVTDNTFFLFLMATLFWTLSLYGGYTLTRHNNAWRAIIPAGVAIVIIHIYDSFFTIRTWYLASYLFFAMLLLARVHFLTLTRKWVQRKTYLPPYFGLDYIRIALIITTCLVLFSWTAPALAKAISPIDRLWHQATSPWNTIREQFQNAFSSLRPSVIFISDFYGDTLSLGRGNPLSDSIMLSVESPSLPSTTTRLYWRARVYDHYEGFWSNSTYQSRSLTPNQFDIVFPEYEGRSTEVFKITTYHRMQNIYTPPQPTWVSRPAEVYLANNPDGTSDLGFMEAKPFLGMGEIYQVEVSLSTATIAQLREAGTDYPEWILERYLQVPDTITDRMRELAFEIAGDREIPYDITLAVTNYLRNNLRYSETIPSPPLNQEPLDWVLFDHGEAFCNYYASAQVIMLRSLGIPARMAVGYAQGERLTIDNQDIAPNPRPQSDDMSREELNRGTDYYTVRQRDAHAWPEVYFPGLGWVEFEPTASQAAITRPLGRTPDEISRQQSDLFRDEMDDLLRLMDDFEEEIFAEGSNPFIGPIIDDEPPPPSFRLWSIIGFISLALVTLLIRRVRTMRGSPPIPVQIETSLQQIGLDSPKFVKRWSNFATLSPITKAYLELNRALMRLGSPPQATNTPSERADELTQLLPVAVDPIRTLITEYQTSTYSPKDGNIEMAQRAGKDIRNKSYLALIQRLVNNLIELVPFSKNGYQAKDKQYQKI